MSSASAFSVTIRILVLLTHSVESNAEKTARCIKQAAKHAVKRFTARFTYKNLFHATIGLTGFEFSKKNAHEERFSKERMYRIKPRPPLLYAKMI